MALRASDPGLARNLARRGWRCVAKIEQPPRGAAEATDAVRRALRRLPTGQSAKVIVGPWQQPLAISAVTGDDLPAASTLAVRAKPIRAGGSRPAVRFQSASEEKAFTLLAGTEDMARKVGQHLYKQIDIVARVVRDEEGAVESGVLESFAPVGEEETTEAWRDWFESNGAEWNRVEDLEIELDRIRG